MRKKTKLLYIYDGEDPNGWYAIKLSEESINHFYMFIADKQVAERDGLIILRNDIYPSRVSVRNDQGLPCAPNVWRKSIVECFNSQTSEDIRINTKRTAWGQRYAASAMFQTMISRFEMSLERGKSLGDSCAEIVA